MCAAAAAAGWAAIYRSSVRVKKELEKRFSPFFSYYLGGDREFNRCVC